MKNWLSSLYISFSTLTRLPMGFQKSICYDEENCTRSAAFFPLVGLFFGLVLASALLILNFFVKDIDFLSFMLLTIPYCLNKFFHLDGLADTFDGFLADRSKEERLVIMKDSSTGSFALGGIILFLLLKFLLIKKLLTTFSYFLPLIIIIPVLSRYGIIFLCFISKYPRKSGTGKSLVGQIKPLILILSSIIAFLILFGVLLIAGFKILPFFIGGLVTVIISILMIRAYSNKKIGGVTGDVLGASAEVLELLLIAVFLIIKKTGGIL